MTFNDGLDLDSEIAVMRLRMQGDDVFAQSTLAQQQIIAILFAQGLGTSKRDIRITALRIITGLNIETSKNLTLHTLSVIIDTIAWRENESDHLALTWDGVDFLYAIRKRIERRNNAST